MFIKQTMQFHITHCYLITTTLLGIIFYLFSFLLIMLINFCQEKKCLRIAKYGYNEIRYDDFKKTCRFIYIHCVKHKYRFEEIKST
jgi:hypothetical protein